MSDLKGVLPDYIVKGLRISKLGIFSGEVDVKRKVSGTKSAAINPDWLLPTAAPDPFGIPCVGATASIAGSVVTVEFSYEGGTSTQPDQSESDYVVEIDSSMGEAPIEAHPSFSALKAKYGWADDKFPEFVKATTTSALPGKTADIAATSPAYGIESWLVVGAVLRVSFSGRTVPSWVMKGIGTIIARPQGFTKLGISLPPKRNWLKLGPKITEKGNRYQIVCEFMLSGPRGWNKDIYNFGQLE